MKKRRLIIRTVILAVLLGALGSTLYTTFFTEKELVMEGSVAPDFILQDLNGNTIQLSDYRGQGVFLNFWGTWCPPCKEEMPYIENQYQQYKDQGVTVIAVDVDESELAVRNFVEAYGLTFPVPIDKGSEVTGTYGIGPLPTTLLVDKDGIVVKKITGRMTEAQVQQFMELIKP